MAGNSSSTKEITISELAKHNTPNNAWMAINGKVYDVTNYISRHPGGRSTIIQGIGKDATEMFMHAHNYVSPEFALAGKQVGVLKRNNL